MPFRRTSIDSSQRTGFYSPKRSRVVGSRIAHSISPDPDAEAYLLAVEAADGEPLEAGVVNVVTDFVVGCKSDGIWDAVKASCILAGARTLAGALVPLVGTAPTNYNFVEGDYSRTTGLVGDYSTKYLSSNRANNADPQNNNHNAAYVSQTGASGLAVIAGGVSNTGDNYTDLIPTISGTRHTNRNSSNTTNGTYTIGLVATSRDSSASYTYKVPGASQATRVISSQTPSSTIVTIFARGGGASGFSDHRISFYSIGESLDLALLDNRVTVLMSGIQNAIP